MPFDEASETPVENRQILKGFAIEKDRYVTFEPNWRDASQEVDGTEYCETSYYAAPDRGAEKPYALLFAALAETDYAGHRITCDARPRTAPVIRP
jgi:non-homologous end joining protein Ku